MRPGSPRPARTATSTSARTLRGLVRSRRCPTRCSDAPDRSSTRLSVRVHGSGAPKPSSGLPHTHPATTVHPVRAVARPALQSAVARQGPPAHAEHRIRVAQLDVDSVFTICPSRTTYASRRMHDVAKHARPSRPRRHRASRPPRDARPARCLAISPSRSCSRLSRCRDVHEAGCSRGDGPGAHAHAHVSGPASGVTTVDEHTPTSMCSRLPRVNTGHVIVAPSSSERHVNMTVVGSVGVPFNAKLSGQRDGLPGIERATDDSRDRDGNRQGAPATVLQLDVVASLSGEDATVLKQQIPPRTRGPSQPTTSRAAPFCGRMNPTAPPDTSCTAAVSRTA